ncbi:unnamed protein product, partial [marine sediment metagenome]
KPKLHGKYKPKEQTSVNLDAKILMFLRYLKKEKYTPSVTASINEMLTFAIPHFFNLVNEEIPKKILNGEITNIKYQIPEHTKATLKDLREAYPNIIDYKFINEGK